MMSSTMITIAITTIVPQPSPEAALTGDASERSNRSFLASSLKAVATAPLSILLPEDQVSSLAERSIDSRAPPTAKSRLKVFCPRSTCQ